MPSSSLCASIPLTIILSLKLYMSAYGQAAFSSPRLLGRNPFWLVRLIEVGTEMTSRSGILRTAAQQALSKELAKAAHSERRWSRPSTLPPDQCVSECLHALAQMALDMDLRRNLSRKACGPECARMARNTALAVSRCTLVRAPNSRDVPRCWPPASRLRPNRIQPSLSSGVLYCTRTFRPPRYPRCATLRLYP